MAGNVFKVCSRHFGIKFGRPTLHRSPGLQSLSEQLSHIEWLELDIDVIMQDNKFIYTGDTEDDCHYDMARIYRQAKNAIHQVVGILVKQLNLRRLNINLSHDGESVRSS